MVDVDKVLKFTVKKGKVKIGTKETRSVITMELLNLLLCLTIIHILLRY